MKQGKILIIRGGAIGDFILTLPAIAALRRQFPQVHLEVLGYPHIAQLALAGGLVDRVQAIEARPLAAFFARGGELSEDMRNYFSEFDLIVSYLYDPDEIFRTNVARCSPAQFIAGPHRAGEREKTHATRTYLKPLERLAIFDADATPRLPIRGTPHAQPTLALHPGSGSERKNWPERKWADLLARLMVATDLRLLLVGGEAEGERLQHLASALPPARREVLQSLPLADLAARLQPCAAFVGHDSGITHLAAALGLPALVLWADTVQEVWRPRGERVALLGDAAGIGSITVERVTQELDQLLVGAK
jgi:heptosyltransferase-3